MKVLLINPYMTTPMITSVSTPLGLISIVSYMRKFHPGHEIVFSDFYNFDPPHKTPRGWRQGLTDAECERVISSAQPDVIGITCMFTSFYEDPYEIARLCRRIHPNAKIVMGGPHVSYDIPHALNNCCVDVVVINEGEVTFGELIETWAHNDDLRNVKGIAFKDGDQVVTTPSRPYYPNLDDLPRPAYELLDFDSYSRSAVRGQLLKGNRIGAIFTSRGCPYDCVFCSTKQMWTRKWRWQSAERVFEDIKFLVEEFGVDEINITDDSYIVNIHRAEKICDYIIESGLKVNIHVMAGMTIWLLTHDLLRKLRDAGLYRIRLPIETGNERTLEYINKPVDLKKSRELVPYLHELGIWTQACFIIGFPYETREDIMETVRYAEDSMIDHVDYLVAQPYAGADMYDDYHKLGLLNPNSDNTFSNGSTYFETQYDTVHLKAHEIKGIQRMAVWRYQKLKMKRFLSPRYLVNHFLPKVNSHDKFRFFMRIVKFFILYRAYVGLYVLLKSSSRLVGAKIAGIKDYRFFRHLLGKLPAFENK